MVNTLVKHKKLSKLGIGCIAKELKNSYKVNFGEDDVITCKKDLIIPIDTSVCKEIKFSDLRSMSIVNSPKLPRYAIIGNEVKNFVGIGWVTQRVVTEEDLTKYPRVVNG